MKLLKTYILTFCLFYCTGLKEYFGANPTLTVNSPSIILSNSSNMSSGTSNFEDIKVNEEFFDAIAANEPYDQDSDSDSDSESLDLCTKFIYTMPKE